MAAVIKIFVFIFIPSPRLAMMCSESIQRKANRTNLIEIKMHILHWAANDKLVWLLRGCTRICEPIAAFRTSCLSEAIQRTPELIVMPIDGGQSLLTALG
jgi:hypothetical protein